MKNYDHVTLLLFCGTQSSRYWVLLATIIQTSIAENILTLCFVQSYFVICKLQPVDYFILTFPDSVIKETLCSLSSCAIIGVSTILTCLIMHDASVVTGYSPLPYSQEISAKQKLPLALLKLAILIQWSCDVRRISLTFSKGLFTYNGRVYLNVLPMWLEVIICKLSVDGGGWDWKG